MQQSLRRWIFKKETPGDVKKFTPEEQKNILAGAKKAWNEDKFEEYTNALFDNGQRFGLRKFYYQSHVTTQSDTEEYLKSARAGALDPLRTTEAESPSLFSSRTKKRKTIGSPKPGSIFTNTMNAYKSLVAQNTAAKDISKLYKMYNEDPMSDNDKDYLDSFFSKVLRKGEKIRQPFKLGTKTSGLFWTTHQSPIANYKLGDSFMPKAFQLVARNGLQPVAEGGQVVNARSFTKHSMIVANAMLRKFSLSEIDVEMGEDFKNSFGGYVSQKQSIYRDTMFMDLGRSTTAANTPEKVIGMAKVLLEKTGKGYVAIDNLDRAIAWPAQYLTVKDAALRYQNKEITANKFLDLTLIDTMMKDAQVETALDLLEGDNVRELANYVADITVFDIHRGYKVTERAGVERTAEQRTLTGILTYPRGRYDLYFNRGLKRIYEGIKDGDFSKAKRAAQGVGKGVVGSEIADAILKGLGIGGAYSVIRAGYNILSPVAKITSDAGSRVGMIQDQVADGSMSPEDGAAAVGDIVYDTVDDIIHILPDRKKKE